MDEIAQANIFYPLLKETTNIIQGSNLNFKN